LSTAAASTRTAQILVVEDEGIVAKDIAGSLTRLGYNVVGIASSGEEAVTLAGLQRPDLILMDIVLRGELDGIDAAERIRRDIDVPIVYLTAYGDSRTLERAKVTVPYGYLLKPWQERELQTVIEITLHKHRLEQRLKEAYQALDTAAREWRLTFDVIPAPVLVLDWTGRIVRGNAAAQQLAARRSEEWVGEPVTSLGPNQPWPKIAELAVSIRRQPTEGGQVVDPATGRAWDIACRVWRGTGDERRIIVIATDITKLLELQSSLQRSETMSAMGALVAAVAHEARNPLFGLTAHLDVLEGSAHKEQEEPIRRMRYALGRLTGLMDQLLEYGKPLAKELAAGSLGDVVKDAVEACQPLAARAQVTVQTDIAPDLPRVRMNASRLVQLFKNVVENAVQHSRRGERVEITAEPKEEDGARWVVCRVLDRGPGIGAEDAAKLFDPFYSRRDGGTGLGLSIVQRIVQEHGGKIEIGNRATGGAVVTVMLPQAG
jgi:signal transduction histidine kinase